MARLRIHDNYLTEIANGTKTMEIRVGYDHIKRIGEGDRLELASSQKSVQCRVSGVRKYRSFLEMLANEEVEKALPGTTKDAALKQLRRIYPAGKEQLGVFVIEVSDCH
jgi:ASC-1-like (ASCH) protein